MKTMLRFIKHDVPGIPPGVDLFGFEIIEIPPGESARRTYARQGMIVHPEMTKEELAGGLRKLADAFETGHGLVTIKDPLRGNEINIRDVPAEIVRALETDAHVPEVREPNHD